MASWINSKRHGSASSVQRVRRHSSRPAKRLPSKSCVMPTCRRPNFAFSIIPLQPTQDYKAAFDGDQGPNTGGMGAYCPAPLGTPELRKEIDETILVPTVHAMKRRRSPFRGVLYVGLIITNQGPRVLEFNC